ncbi:unnamed protein product, partial [Rotaria magnacalcarata]
IGLIVSGLPNYEKPGKQHLAEAFISSGSSQNNPNSSNLQISRQDSSTGISMLSSCPQTPALR